MYVAELLHVNDQLNNVALRYERYERMRSGGSAAAVSDAASPAPALELAPSSSVCNFSLSVCLQFGFQCQCEECTLV